MKLYKANFDFNRPSTQMVTMPVDSDTLIGFGFVKDGDEVQIGSDSISMTDGTNTIACSGTHAGIPFLKYPTIDGNAVKSQPIYQRMTGTYPSSGRSDTLFMNVGQLAGTTIQAGNTQTENGTYIKFDFILEDGTRKTIVNAQTINIYSPSLRENKGRILVTKDSEENLVTYVRLWNTELQQYVIGDSITLDLGDRLDTLLSYTSDDFGKPYTAELMVGKPVTDIYDVDKEWTVNVNKQPETYDTGVTGVWAEGAYEGLDVYLTPLLGKTVKPGDLQKEFYCEANPALTQRSCNIGTVSQHVGSNWINVAWIYETYIMALNPSTGVAEYVDSFTFDAESEYVFRAGTVGTVTTDGYAYAVRIVYGKPITGSFKLVANVDESLTVEVDDANTHEVSWTDVEDKPDIPDSTSDLTNDSGFITSAALPTNVSDLTNDAGYITASAIPSNVSTFTNDAGYITASAIPSNVSTFTNDAGYLTSVSWTDVQNKPTIPTTTSQLTNNSDFTTKAYVDGLIGTVLSEGF